MAILRPSSDLVAGGWTSSPSGTLASCIDETTASDTDYIETTGTGNSSIILLGSGSDPGNDNNHQLRYRASSTSETLNVDVVQMAPAIVTSKRKWNRQPQVPARINVTNSLTRDLLYVQNGRYGTTKPGVIIPTSISSGVSIGACSGGSGYTFSGGAKSVIYPSLPGNIGASDPFSIVVYCAVTASPSLAGYFGVGTYIGAPGADRALLSYQGTNNRNIYFFGEGRDANSGVEWSIDGKPQMVVATRATGSSTIKFYKNGVYVSSATLSGSLASNAYRKPRLGDMGRGWNSSPTGVIFQSAYFTSELSANYINSLWMDKFQIFQPRKQIQYFDAPKLIATRTPSLTSSPSDQTIDLTSGEAAAITDYTKLGLRFRT